jgi:predicted metal-dependent hydrolase
VFGLRKKKSRIVTPAVVAPAEIGGVRVKTSVRARRMALRVDSKIGDIVLTWPRGASESYALRFIERNRDWIEQHRRKLPPPKSFAEGEVISVYGCDYKIVRKEGRGLSRLEAGQLIIHSRPEHLSRRIKDFLKEKAREVLLDATAAKLTDLSLKMKEVRVIDPKTRWGSCSPDGRMMFSWRLILAPPEVLDYVVAHEAAHRIHMNHSRKFWALCASLTENAGASRKWLRKNGHALMAYR